MPRTKRPAQIDYNRMERRWRKKSDALAKRVATGKITPEKWDELMTDLLADAHTEATVLGRQRSGDLADKTKDDETFGAAVATDEARYLDGFREDIADGRYSLADGTTDVGKVQRRAGAYVSRLLGTANEAFVAASPAKKKFWWELGAVVERHCEDCPAMADGSPWAQENLDIYPRSGGTKCLFNCHCNLRRSDGIRGFTPPA